jgi:hypothetical protein
MDSREEETPIHLRQHLCQHLCPFFVERIYPKDLSSVEM